jgi:flagellar basal-body rod modification protein FlgD
VSIPATEAVTASTPTASGLAPSGTTAAEDKQMFLELMVAQLRYQDPLNPTDSGEFLALSAQFTALEKMQDVADRTAELLGAQLAFGASGLVGRHVTWTDAEGATLAGTVDGVTFGAAGPILDVGGTEVPLASIVSVTASPTTPADPPPADPDSSTPAA